MLGIRNLLSFTMPPKKNIGSLPEGVKQSKKMRSTTTFKNSQGEDVESGLAAGRQSAIPGDAAFHGSLPDGRDIF